MADFYVPIATGLYTDLNQQIAAGPPKPDLSFIGNALDNYNQGGQIKQQDALRNVFQNGLPRDAQGNIDFGQASEMLAKAGGAGQIQNVIGLQNAQLGRQVLGSTGVMPPNGPAASGPSASQPVGPPSSSTSIPNSAPQAVQPQANPNDTPTGTPMPPGQNLTGPNTTITGIDYGPTKGGGGVTPRMIADRTGGDAQALAQRLGVSVDQVLDPNDPQVRATVAEVARGGQQPQGASFNSRFAAASGPTLNQGQPVQPQGQPQGQPQQAPQQDPAALAQAYETRANYFYQQAKGLAFVNPAAAQAAKAQGDQASEQALAIRKGLVANTEMTPEEKNARASGQPSPVAFEGAKKVQDTNITAGQKQYEGIQAQSTQYERDLKPYLDVSKSIINDPKFYSGIGGELSLDFNRVKAALGDKNAAVLQEALSKVTASSVLAQINNQRAQLQEAGGNSGRIFRQQVELVEKAAPSLANTPAGNRFLVEVSSRMGDLAGEVAQMARAYKQQHGYLDSGFDQKLSGYMKQHPVFTPQEMTHPEILGAPTVPQQYASNVGTVQNWARAMGVKPGEAIRFPDGSVRAMQYGQPQQ